MRAWKFEPKPEAMTMIRHGDSSRPVILENVSIKWDGDRTVPMDARVTSTVKVTVSEVFHLYEVSRDR